MAKVEETANAAEVHTKNVGGITETKVRIPTGVTILTGRNATNRTSFLQSVMAALGSQDVTLKGDADEGTVELEIDGERYTRTLKRTNGSVSFTGDPYLEEPTIADLFAFLLESNEARQAVIQKKDLREVIMRPIDTDEIKSEINRLEQERKEIDDELQEIDSLKEELPSLEEQKRSLESEIDEKRAELGDVEDDIESLDADVDETREEKQELESRLEDLRDVREDLEQVRNDIDIQEESIASLRNELATLQDERDELPDTPMGDHQEIEQRISNLRNRKEELDTEIRSLKEIIQFNEEMLEGSDSAVCEALSSNNSSFENLTDQLVEEDPTICWTCGSEVEEGRIDETLETIRSVVRDHMSEVREIEEELDDLQSNKREREQQQRRRKTLERKVREVEDEINDRQSQLDSLRDRRNSLSDEIEDLEKEVEALESEDFSEIRELHKEANQLEFELGQLESDLDDVTNRIKTIEDRLNEEAELKNQREEITDELEAQRTQIERIEREAVEEFNTHMDDVLDLLDYDNLSRIWIERVQKTVKQGRRKVDKNVFELHVVRTTESGATYEDTISHLSESEREVTGLTFALAGYLVHDVHETVPFMLLDSLEAIDSNRLADLVTYFSDYMQYLIVALLPEDAQSLPDEYNRVTEI